VSAIPSPDDRVRVRELLGRQPQGAYTIAARDDAGDPVVIQNAPLLDDGTPMPTLYWLVGPEEIRRIGRLEAAGGVDAAEAAVDPDELAAAHARYAAQRDALIPADHDGPRPYGGVGGTRAGVKCLHAHWAWHLAGGDDPVGRWIAEQLGENNTSLTHVRVAVAHDDLVVTLPSGHHHRVPWGPRNLTAAWLDDDPPHPAGLTNALGAIDDHLDDIEREHPGLDELARDPEAGVAFSGDIIASLAAVELGSAPPDSLVLERDAAEELFRVLATESAADRAHNPGLPSHHVGTIVAACCVVLAVMRRFHLDHVTLLTVPDTPLRPQIEVA
jgi:hypothetical protein